LKEITREAALKEQLVEEETKRRAEMESMFEVIHVEPKVLLDFIEDADYEFNTINRLLKDRSKSSQEVVVEIYQSIHAIKSNAVILGLQSFAQKLHVFEERIKLLRDREEDVQFEDILQITFALENLMKTEDSFKEIIEKISNFGSEHEKVGESFVLIELLKKASEKTALSENKMVRFEASDIDPLLISGKYRRNLKEILLQLVRNSVVHGIEQPDYRMDIGKEKEGLIRLQTEKRGDSLLVLLSDNGSGIDFAQISKNAIANKLIPESLSKNKKALTNLLFSPGFSTASKTDHNAGRGVGLHLVKERLKEIGGTLKLKSENGKGTLFAITIPLS
jgi:two-component system chemotaxis sensor kinase CheA